MDRRELFSSIINSGRKHSISAADPSLERWQPDASNPWDRSAAKHLFHRLGIPANKQWIDDAVARDPQVLLDELFDDRLLNDLLPGPPEGAEKWLEVTPYQGNDPSTRILEQDTYKLAMQQIRYHFTTLMTERSNLLREKLTLFWSNHFAVTEEKNYFPQGVYQIYEIYRKHAWGNFKELVKQVTINPAMLVFLDNVWNEKDMLNENYARELMELFTMGLFAPDGTENYTQEDVRDVANALCGWRFKFYEPAPVLPPYFAWYYFDYVTKRTPLGAPPKIYGLAASKDPEIDADIIDTIFEQRAESIANFISQKLYKHFVHRDASTSPAQQVIKQMAALFKQDWEIKPMLELLLRSRHFFDIAFRGAIIKSPYDFMLGAINHCGIQMDQFRAGALWWRGWEMGQFLLNPVNVKGWPGHRTWMTSGTLVKRVEFVNDLITRGEVANDWAWILWWEDDVVGWAKQFEWYQEDFRSLAKEIADILFAIDLTEEALASVIDQVQDFPSYEWGAMPQGVRVPVIRRLLYKLMLLPEYQLS
jgi:uncharacterized protein (DUF1800 family)